MTFFDKIFISLCHYFKKRGAQDSRWAAACLLCAIQAIIIFTPPLTIKTILQSTFLSSLHPYSKVVAIPIFGLWLLLAFRHYNKDRTAVLSQEYNSRPQSFRRFWNWAPFVILILFFIIFFFLVLLNERLKSS